jgi:hypothetical protein
MDPPVKKKTLKMIVLSTPELPAQTTAYIPWSTSSTARIATRFDVHDVF